MKPRFVKSLPIVALALALMVSGHFSPARSAPTPTDKVRQVMDSAMKIQTRPDLEGTDKRPERMKLVRKIIQENFLSEEMGRETLGDVWGSLNANQRTEFTALFSSLFQDSYTRLVLNFLQQENIEYRKETVTGKTATVETVIQRPNERINVNYTLREKNGEWAIADVEIDGVSIVAKYKSSFMKVIREGSVNELLNKLRLQKRAMGGGN